jgi:hypothetical protein
VYSRGLVLSLRTARSGRRQSGQALILSRRFTLFRGSGIFSLVKTVSKPTSAEIATRAAETNWILSVASTFVAAGSKTPYFPTY